MTYNKIPNFKIPSPYLNELKEQYNVLLFTAAFYKIVIQFAELMHNVELISKGVYKILTKMVGALKNP